MFSDKKDSLKLDIVIKNGNIYIKSINQEKIQIVDENSNIEFINSNYKKINKEEVNNYKFEFNDVINKNIKKRYASIFNPITMITKGFKSILEFSALKKILLLGFFASAMFLVYAVSTILRHIRS